MDSATGKYYLRARFYNPVIGRFTQQDTYHGDGLNLYAYCQNNPVMYCDPTGHDSSSAADKAWQNYMKKRSDAINNSVDKGTNAMNNYVDKGTNAMNNAVNNDSSGKKSSTSGNKNDNSLNQKKNEQKKKAEEDSGSKTEEDVKGKKNSSENKGGIFNGVNEADLRDSVRRHVFSDKHIKAGIMKLGKDQNDILNKGINVIKGADAQGMISEGPTQIKTHINGVEVEIRVYVVNGKIINFDMFKGWSERNMGNTIFY